LRSQFLAPSAYDIIFATQTKHFRPSDHKSFAGNGNVEGRKVMWPNTIAIRWFLSTTTVIAEISWLIHLNQIHEKKQSCIAKSGTVSLAIGQDLGSIQNYTHDLTTTHPCPFGLMSYTTIKNEHGELTGLTSPIDYGSGIEWSSGLIMKYPGSSLQIGMWLVDQCDLINSGAYDYLLNQLAVYIKLNSGVAFYIRVGYEFDSYENHYDPESYKLAFQRIARHFREANATNVALVWHASRFIPRDGLSLDAWYPGNEYVDWCGVSLFQQPYDNDFTYAEQLISFCKAHGHKPVMIAESTPYGGFVQGNDS